MTDAELDRLCGTPSQTFDERLDEDARRMATQIRYLGGVIE